MISLRKAKLVISPVASFVVPSLLWWRVDRIPKKRFEGQLPFAVGPAKPIWSLAPAIAANYGFKE